MTVELSSVKNLLLDLGGVLYEIDVPGTIFAFQQLFPGESETMAPSPTFQHSAFKRLDRGEISIDQMANLLISDWNLRAETEDIREIWKNLLVGLYPARTRMVEDLSKHFELALLSNTCRFHYDHYLGACWEMFSYMQHLFFSFDVGMLKPDSQMYAFVLDRMGWKAEETLFLDDTPANIAGAEALGMQTVWIENPEVFEELVQTLTLKEPS